MLVCLIWAFSELWTLGLEQSKAKGDEACKEEQSEEDSTAKDILIKRKVPAVILGQAISVVGGYSEKPSATEPPAAPKRLPEPILPSAPTKWVLALHSDSIEGEISLVTPHDSGSLQVDGGKR